MSFCRETRSQHLTLEPPRECAYLCNLAVSPASRRQGVGRALLRAAEEVAAAAGEEALYLHLRFKDKPAEAMYMASRYEVRQVDSPLVELLRMDRRRLLSRDLAEVRAGLAGGE